jgi:hypothetical protein
MSIKDELAKTELAVVEAFGKADDTPQDQAKNKLLALLSVLDASHHRDESISAPDVAELHHFVNEALILLNSGGSNDR